MNRSTVNPKIWFLLHVIQKQGYYKWRSLRTFIALLLTLIAMMMEAVSTSETSDNLYETTRRNIPEDSHLLEHVLRGR
jgi:hypothetical protein